ncbi:MAG TPA: hypothetical protein VGL82_18965 [Bryobacteraceae bacterium]
MTKLVCFLLVLLLPLGVAPLSAQLLRTETVPIGTIVFPSNVPRDDRTTQLIRLGMSLFFFDGGVAIRAEVNSKHEKLLTMEVRGKHEEMDSVILSPQEVATMVENLNQMVDESAKSSDDFSYEGNSFIVGINGGTNSKFSLFTRNKVLATTIFLTETENRDVLKSFVALLKKGQAVLDSK